jgi:hypothetical protein
MHLALPITHRGRFWASFGSGFTVVGLPYVASFTIGLLIFRIFTHVENFEELINIGLYMAENVATRGNAEVVPVTIDGFIGTYVFPVAFTGFMVLLFVYVLTTFCNTICGKLLTAGFLPFLLSVLIPLLILSLSTLALHYAHGVSGIGNYPYVISSPLGMLFGTVGMAGEYIVFPMSQPIYVIPSILIIGGLLTASFYLSKNVRAENIGRDFLYKGVYNVQQALICLCVIALFGMLFVHFSNVIVAFLAFFLTFVIYFISHVLHHKGLNKIKSGAVRYALTVMLSVMLCIILVGGRGFGASNRVPAVWDVQAVRIVQWGSPTLVSDTFPTQMQWSFLRQENFTRDEWQGIVTEAQRIHREFIDTRMPRLSNEQLWSSGEMYSINIDYVLSSGIIISREYRYNASGIDTLVESGILTRERQPNSWHDFDFPWSDWENFFGLDPDLEF